MDKEAKELWLKNYIEFCKESGGELTAFPGFMQDKNDGSYKIGIQFDVIPYKGD